ncbi:unnamed protein product [Lota lota]
MDELFVKPGNQERGWNDPPQFSYSLQVAGSTRSPLSKRGHPTPAADPLPDQQTTPPPTHGITPPPHGVTPPPHGVTPPPHGVTPPPHGVTPPSSQATSCGNLQAVSSVLAQALEACRQNVSRQVCEDIAKRLRLLEDSWRSGRLSSTVKRRMNALTLEMKSAHWGVADDIHRSLMVDHVTEVSQWMVGIKRLIAETRNLNPELLAFSPTDPVQPGPPL